MGRRWGVWCHTWELPTGHKLEVEGALMVRVWGMAVTVNKSL